MVNGSLGLYVVPLTGKRAAEKVEETLWVAPGWYRDNRETKGVPEC